LFDTCCFVIVAYQLWLLDEPRVGGHVRAILYD
jgi:hypothetical protein